MEMLLETGRWKRAEAPVFAENKNDMNVLEKKGFLLEGIKKGTFKNGSFTDEYIWDKWLS